MIQEEVCRAMIEVTAILFCGGVGLLALGALARAGLSLYRSRRRARLVQARHQRKRMMP
jgi:hypothetical protein